MRFGFRRLHSRCATKPIGDLERTPTVPSRLAACRGSHNVGGAWLANNIVNQFMVWIKRHAPNLVGILHHSEMWLNSVQASRIQACRTCIASSLHAVVFAPGTPSLLARIIDVASINRSSLSFASRVYTTCKKVTCHGRYGWPVFGTLVEGTRENDSSSWAHGGLAPIPQSSSQRRCIEYKPQSICIVLIAFPIGCYRR